MTVRTEASREALEAKMATILSEALEGGQRVSTWRWKGYEGWSLPGASWGRREMDDIGVVKGELANDYWYVLSGYARNVSRMDLAVTLPFSPASPNFAHNQWLKIQEAKETQSVGRKYTYIRNLDGGTTLYVGSRTSDEFGRLYDKASQQSSGPEGSVWRWEVELKRQRAKQAVRDLRNHAKPSIIISQFVRQWFEARMVNAPWKDQDGQLNMERSARINSLETTLEWLRSQVKPAIFRLIREGHHKQVVDALQLDMWSSLDQKEQVF